MKLVGTNELMKRLLRREQRRPGERWLAWQWRKWAARVKRAL